MKSTIPFTAAFGGFEPWMLGRGGRIGSTITILECPEVTTTLVLSKGGNISKAFKMDLIVAELALRLAR